jgi:hypothetical protein
MRAGMWEAYRYLFLGKYLDSSFSEIRSGDGRITLRWLLKRQIMKMEPETGSG